jgi:cold shock CspA family protein
MRVHELAKKLGISSKEILKYVPRLNSTSCSLTELEVEEVVKLTKLTNIQPEMKSVKVEQEVIDLVIDITLAGGKYAGFMLRKLQAGKIQLNVVKRDPVSGETNSIATLVVKEIKPEAFPPISDVVKQQIKAAYLATIRQLGGPSANLASVGETLKKLNPEIDYTEFGVTSLSEIIEMLPEFEMKTVSSVGGQIRYIGLKELTSSNERVEGTVISIFTNGYGFILPNIPGAQRLYWHVTNWEDVTFPIDSGKLYEGDTVSFVYSTNKKGPCADKIRFVREG